MERYGQNQHNKFKQRKSNVLVHVSSLSDPASTRHRRIGDV